MDDSGKHHFQTCSSFPHLVLFPFGMLLSNSRMCAVYAAYIDVLDIYIPVPISTTKLEDLSPIQNAVGATFCMNEKAEPSSFVERPF